MTAASVKPAAAAIAAIASVMAIVAAWVSAGATAATPLAGATLTAAAGTPVHAANAGGAVVVGATGPLGVEGYWVAESDGLVVPEGGAASYGDAHNADLAASVVAIAAIGTSHGYYLVGADGGVFTYGDATFYGSTAGVRLNQPVLGVAADPTAGGYWLVARDGGVFNFGAARFFGSAARAPLPAPAIAVIPTADGGGYWVVLGNGTATPFGDAQAIPAGALATSGYSLVGQIVGIDPGHNGGNGGDPAYIDQPVWNGREYEACDTTGTETDGGYTEAAYNFDVATRLEQLLQVDGAEVVMTRSSNTGVGPCVNTRAQILDAAPSDVAIDIHADGGPAWGRGTTVLEPVADGPNDDVIGSSDQLAVLIRDHFEQATGEPNSDYYGTDGLQPRDDLAGLNLTTVPKVLIETANMRNATDASLVTNAGWRQEAAQGLAAGLSQFLIGYP